MDSFSYFHLGFLFYLMGFCSCWKHFTSLRDLNLTDSDPKELHAYSEYVFGDCMQPDKEFLAHVHKDSTEILGRLIVRGWLKINRTPKCIILRATSYEEGMLRATAFRTQICVPSLTFCYSRRRYIYYYYEWYIPPDVVNQSDWDIYFYGNPS